MIQPQRADADTDQAQRGVADGSGHASHLAVAAFGDDQLQPGGGNVTAFADRRLARPQPRWRCDAACLCRAGEAVLEAHAAAQRAERGLVWLAFHLRQVGLGQLEGGVGDALLQAAVAGQQQQALGVAVQPSGRVQPGQG
ncbi:MAG: hypothetical protein Kow0073_08400 [Immundisolibacter sp.]